MPKSKKHPKKQSIEEEVEMIEDDLDQVEDEHEVQDEAVEEVEDELDEEELEEEPKETKKKKHRVTKSDQAEIEQGLEAIYGKNKMDFSKVERQRTRLTSILLTVVITLAIVAATAWLGFFIYQKYFSDTSDKQFEIAIQIDDELASGQMTTIEINYKNLTNVPVADLQIDANLPTAFHLKEAQPGPSDIEEMTWDIGSLATGSDETITIQGVWIAEVPSSTPIQVFANYRPSNFNADFQEIKTVYVNTTSSTLETTFEGTEEAQPGQNVQYQFSIENTGEETMTTVEAELELPDGFFLESSDPTITAGEAARWRFDEIEAGEKIDVKISGSFAADTEGFQYFTVKTSIQDDNRVLLQSKAEGFTDIVGDNLSIQLVANGSNNNVTADLGGSLRISLALENTGENQLDDLSLLLDFKSDKSIPLNWNDAELDGGAITSDGILWNNAALGSLTPGEKRILNLTFPIRDSLNSTQADTFDILAAASIGDLTIKSTPVHVSIVTQAAFAAEARYYTENGAPLGNGPLPPTVGVTTTYRVFWQIDNQLHQLNNVTVQAILPPHVTWSNQFDSDLGNISFDRDTRTVTWSISQLPTTIDHVEATFAISISPDGNDIGTFVKLISGSTLTATDDMTKTTITKSTESLTTELPDDEYAAGKGVVEQPI